MINYAHRGASAYAPENTMAAFYLGIEMGADGIETDIRKTGDGMLVLSHDSSLKRTAGLDTTIEQCSYAQLLQMNFGFKKEGRYANERIVLFEDFLKYFAGKDLHFAVEIKEVFIEHEVVAMLHRYNCLEKSIVTSFSLDILLSVHAFDRRLALGHLCDSITDLHINELLEHGIMQICPEACSVSPEKVAKAKQAGLSVRAWGVDDEDAMYRMIEDGVDGMTVDFPDKLTHALSRGQ